MAIKLIATDIDGTLIDGRCRIHKTTLAGIRDAADAGKLIAIATGRSYESALPIAEKAGIGDCPIIACNGASVFIDGSECSRSPLLPGAVQPALRLASDSGAACFLFSHSCMYMYTTGDPLLDKRIIDKASFSKSEEGMYRVMHDDTDLDFVLNMGVEKLLLHSGDPEVLRETRLSFERAAYYGDLPKCRITSSGPDNFEVMREDVTKGVGLMQLCGILGIDSSEVLAVGDNENDVEMLRFAGISVAMGNASPGAIAASNHVTLPVGEGGLGAAIRRYALD